MLRRTYNPGDLDAMRGRAEAFATELVTDAYRTRAGLADASSITAIYARYADLPDKTLFAHLRGEAERLDGDARRRTEYFAAFIGRLVAGALTKELVDKQNAIETDAEVVYPWGHEPYRRSAVTLANEPDRNRRRTIAAAQHVVVKKLTPIARRIVAHHHHAARELGFAGYREAIEQMGRLDLGAVHVATRRFLAETETLYEREMSAVVAERLGQSLDETAACDLPHLWRAPEFDPMFDAARLVPTAEHAVRALGLDIYAGGCIHLDVEPRPRKAPRAFTAAIEIPGRVMLVIAPAGGQNDWRAFFHELGHALHFGHTDATLDFEFRRLGDNSVTEAYAFLVEHLLLDKTFVAEYLPHELASRFLRLAHRALLWMLRRYCAKLDYELVLHDGALDEEKAAVYADTLSRATRVSYDPADSLIDVDHGFYCARYLRAWFFEANLSARLHDQFGPNWFATREAGEFLRSLWEEGQRLRLDEIETRLGFATADPTALITRLTAALAG
ncbi:MAG: hypothetical protein JW889_00360 [Verrucomicrobia bacterium]|nr:hypothetical protein [Verrucomicrobiota bacterium]